MLGDRLYELRRKQGLSQEQLAEKVGVSRQTISKWEGNQSTPDLEKLVLLADSFGVSLDEFVKGDKSELQVAETQTEAEKPAPFVPALAVGLGLCIVGLIGLAVTGLVWLLNPEAIEIINASSALTINGSGLIFTICALSIVIGIYLLLKKV